MARQRTMPARARHAPRFPGVEANGRGHATAHIPRRTSYKPPRVPPTGRQTARRDSLPSDRPGVGMIPATIKSALPHREVAAALKHSDVIGPGSAATRSKGEGRSARAPTSTKAPAPLPPVRRVRDGARKRLNFDSGASSAATRSKDKGRSARAPRLRHQLRFRPQPRAPQHIWVPQE